MTHDAQHTDKSAANTDTELEILSGFERWQIDQIASPIDRACVVDQLLYEKTLGTPAIPPSSMSDPQWYDGQWWESDELIDEFIEGARS